MAVETVKEILWIFTAFNIIRYYQISYFLLIHMGTK